MIGLDTNLLVRYFTQDAYEQGGAGFADYLIAFTCAENNALPLYTFDHAAIKSSPLFIDGNTCGGNMYTGIGYYQTGSSAVGGELTITNNTDCFGMPCDVVGTAGAMTDYLLTEEPEVSRPLVAYVNPDSANPLYPYSTPETAATNIIDAMTPQKDGLVVYVKAGTTNPVKGTIPIRKSIRLVGDGSRETTVVKGDRKGPLLYFYSSATAASVENLTLRDGSVDGGQ